MYVYYSISSTQIHGVILSRAIAAVIARFTRFTVILLSWPRIQILEIGSVWVV